MNSAVFFNINHLAVHISLEVSGDEPEYLLQDYFRFSNIKRG